MIAWEYGMLLADKLVGRFVPVRFALFGLIGGLGLVVHLATLWVALNLLAIGFSASQAIATIVAMTSNFVLNNRSRTATNGCAGSNCCAASRFST